MCGISGILNFKNSYQDSLEQVLCKMSKSLQHRGPDNSSTWIDKETSTGLSHRRLSIIDTSTP